VHMPAERVVLVAGGCCVVCSAGAVVGWLVGVMAV
jgi:hypothetical protein